MSNTVPAQFSTTQPFGTAVATTRAFATLSRASFLGIEFRCDDIRIKGGIDKHVHKYPHRPGGVPEKLGRKLYEITMNAVFLVNDKFYPTAWPGDIGMLRSQFENEVSGDLTIPTVGTIQAYAVDWDITNTHKVMNGERMTIQFEEDQNIEQLTSSPLVLTYTNVGAKYDSLVAEATAANIPLPKLQSITDLVQDIQTLKDQIDDQASVLSTKTQQLADVCRFVDETVSDLQEPPAWRTVSALHDLGVAAYNMNRDLLRKLAPLAIYTVPREMVIAQVATAIYGSADRAVEIMKLNPINDVFSIPANTQLRYYQSAA